MNAPVGLAFFDRDLCFVRINQHLAAAHGRSIDEHLGRPLAEVWPDYPAGAVADLRAVLAGGRPLLGRLVAAGDGAARGGVWQANYYPVPDADGRLLGVGVVTQNV